MELVDLCFAVDEQHLCVSVFDLVAKNAMYTSPIDCARHCLGYLCKSPSLSAEDKPDLNDAIHLSVHMAIPEWEVGLSLHTPSQATPLTYPYYDKHPSLYVPTPVDPGARNIKTSRICKIVNLCFTFRGFRPITPFLAIPLSHVALVTVQYDR